MKFAAFSNQIVDELAGSVSAGFNEDADNKCPDKGDRQKLIDHFLQRDGHLIFLSQTFSITAHSAQLLAHFLVEITFCAMDAVFSRGLRNFLLKFGLGKIWIN
ncbi:hypothetical protein D5078_06765 [Pectobacterium carotovorum]|uniref:hypothetical protein n=2 Tax=Pectobacterium TaxID=122277 RepID=UPI000E7284C3|nr:hypothetical protein [Pectobacterium carotovorum]RJL47257.1 hypothetical protein D5078_06765 [Pectobacterium carotovorum]